MLYGFSKLLQYAALSGLLTGLLAFVNIIYNIYFHPLRKYPGPKLWTATRLMWARSMQSGHYHHQLQTLHQEYGPVVRIAPDELSFINAEAWKDIYGNLSISKNSVWSGQEEKNHPVSIVSTNEATHLKNRRALAGAFTDHAISEHAHVLEGLIGLMLEKFETAAETNRRQTVVDIVDWLNFLTFDISGELSFGETFKSVENGRAHPWVEISCSFGKGIALMASINFFAPLNKLLKLAMPWKIMEKMIYHRQLAHEKLEQRLAMDYKKKAQDYVGSIMAYNDEKGEIKIPKEEIEANMTLLIFAGSETTSTALSAIISQILQNPSALRKAKQEVRSAFRSEDEITVASVAHLEYITAVIQEGIRMGPPAAIGLPRVTPNEGAMISGRHVPGRTFVSVNQYPAFRSPSNFTQPDSFIPERFLADTPFPTDCLDVFEPFLVGRHKCIGQKLAMYIMRLTLARLLHSFDIKAVDNIKDFGQQKTYIFWEKKSLRVEMQLRT